jgi:hypothetical protein
MSISKKIKVKTKVNNNKKYKSKTKSKTKKVDGGGFLSPKPSQFTDLKYPDSKYEPISKLVCPICKEGVFKMRTMKLATSKKAFWLNTNFWDNRFKFFTCINCGKVEIFSEKVTLKQTEV